MAHWQLLISFLYDSSKRGKVGFTNCLCLVFQASNISFGPIENEVINILVSVNVLTSKMFSNYHFH